MAELSYLTWRSFHETNLQREKVNLRVGEINVNLENVINQINLLSYNVNMLINAYNLLLTEHREVSSILGFKREVKEMRGAYVKKRRKSKYSQS